MPAHMLTALPMTRPPLREWILAACMNSWVDARFNGFKFYGRCRISLKFTRKGCAIQIKSDEARGKRLLRGPTGVSCVM